MSTAGAPGRVIPWTGLILTVLAGGGLVLYTQWPRPASPLPATPPATGQPATRPPATPEPPPSARGKLFVFDKETGNLVPGAEVYWLEEHPERKSTSLNPVRAGSVPGEFHYAGPDGVVLFAIEAPGYVGTMHGGIAVEVPSGDALVHDFRLERGGGLRVRFECEGRPVDPGEVRILVPRGPFRGGVTAVGMDARSGIGEKDDLEEGAHGIQVDPGPGYEPVATAHVDIRKGEVAEKTITLTKRETTPDGPAAATGSVRGTVRMHPAWERRSTCVKLVRDGHSTGPDRRVDLRRETPDKPLPFDLGELPAGDYWLEVQPQWRREVVVPPEGAEFHLDVPEPARARVRVVEDATGKPILGSRLSWRSPAPGLDSYADETEVPDPESGEFVFQVPPGHLEFRVTARGWIPLEGGGNAHRGAEGRIQLKSGQSFETTVRLRPAGSLRALVRCEGRPLTNKEVDLVLTLAEPLDAHKAGSVTWWLNGGPGLYRLEDLPTVRYTLGVEDPRKAFLPVPERTIQILPGRATELTVDLERRK